MRQVESLRALAAVGVLLGHAYGLGHGFVATRLQDKVALGGLMGVFLFFVLTGYLLFWPFARRDFGNGARVHLRDYARNRAVRILPLYYVAVVVLLILEEGGGSLEQWWRFLTFSQNFSKETANTVDGPMWTLVVEFQFYVLLPVLAVVLARISRRRKRPAALVLLAAAVVSCIVHEVHHGPFYVWSLSLISTFAFFAAGMLLAFLRLEWTARTPTALKGPFGHSDTWFGLGVVLWLTVMTQYEYWFLLAVSGFLTVGAFVLPLRDGWARRALAWKPLAILGVASYSLYLWHYPILERLQETSTFDSGPWLVLVTLPLLIPVALTSYGLIEAPFLRLRRRWFATAA